MSYDDKKEFAEREHRRLSKLTPQELQAVIDKIKADLVRMWTDFFRRRDEDSADWWKK